MSGLMFALAWFAFGVLVGLVVGPDSEREYGARAEGWEAGYQFAQDERKSQ